MTLHYQHRTFRTTFANNCWTLLTSKATPPLQNQIILSSMTSRLSMECVKWHERLGHANDRIVKAFIKRFVPESKQPDWKPFFCEKCILAKATGHHFLPPSIVPKDEPLNLFVSDVRGPFDPDIKI
ncbi:hypothetical protein PCASD_07554 [Puccinia coronata f. sp. avenae]|uniref:GAG-pre-integrase domain-containing protein n=1 Tax=Puccinia coronata f. sp. avenae TaxID=200324 RepID=A0A2N5TGR4_9BASI|nr:hypothetical protein PCASD_07554 [Puccinia coronata f. sp. avenae]